MVPTSLLPNISKNEVFPNGTVMQVELDRPDGAYKVNLGIDNVVHVKDGRLVQYDCYLRKPEDKSTYVHLIWTFDYDDKMTIYREFPTLNIPKTPYCDVDGLVDKEAAERSNQRWEAMIGDVLNGSMQLTDKVEKVSHCEMCGTVIAHLKDGDQVFWCEHGRE